MIVCPKCGGSLVVVAKRAWCIARYRDGGCGSFFTLNGNGDWREPWPSRQVGAL